MWVRWPTVSSSAGALWAQRCLSACLCLAASALGQQGCQMPQAVWPPIPKLLNLPCGEA